MLKKICLLTFGISAFAACLNAQNVVDEIVVRVNDSIVTRSDVEKFRETSIEDLKQRYPESWQAKWNDHQKDVLRDLIDQQLLVEKAKDLGITGDTEVVKRLNELRRQMNLSTMEEMEQEAQKQGISFQDFKEKIRTDIVTQQVIGREVGSHIQITNDEIQKFYNDHRAEMESPEQVKLAEIQISAQPPTPPAGSQPAEGSKDQAKEPGKDQPPANQPSANQPPPNQTPGNDPAALAQAEAKTKQIVDQLRKGADFADLAKKNSSGPTAAQGGEIGTFKRGELAKEFEDKTFSLKAGEVTDPIRFTQGYLIFEAVAHQNAGVPPLADVENRLRDAIYAQKLEPAARAYLTKLREEAYIDIRQGFIDSGASPNQATKPVLVASDDGSSTESSKSPKKKKRFLLF